MGGDEGSASQTSLLRPQELFATDFAVVRRIRSHTRYYYIEFGYMCWENRSVQRHFRLMSVTADETKRFQRCRNCLLAIFNGQLDLY